MGKGNVKTKAMTMAVAMSMVAGLCPTTTVFAVNGSKVAKDGTYTKTAHVTRTEDDSEDEWNEYDVEVSLKVENGKFSEITVTPKEGYESENASYFNKAYNKSKGIKTLLEGKDATEETVNGWDTVGGATRSSTAIKKAALEAIQSAPEAVEEVKVDTTALEKAIADAEALKEADYTADSWKAMQEKLTAAKTALSKKESQEAVDKAKDELNAAVKALKKAEVTSETYVLMNIPYAKFYAADGVKGADSVSSATKQKTRASLAAGSYHVNSDGSDITGITFPVKISDASALKNYTQITDESKVDITTSMKGNETTTTYSGKDALFESASYSYYILSSAPSYYKEATVNADGSLTFGEVKGAEAQKLSATTKFSTSSKYGDYQLDVDGLPESVNTVYGVVISTKEGGNYGLRHLENIWKKTELAWSTGFVTESHGNTLDSKDYKAMMGQTINKVLYYTDAGIYEISADIYVPEKFEDGLKVEDAAVADKKTNVSVNLPDDYKAEYSVEGLEGVKVENGVLTFTSGKAGKYTLKIKDTSGKYADLSASFILTTEEIPVQFDDDEDALVAGKGYDADDLSAYVQNISKVTVNGTEYAASGKGATKIINSDGSIVADAKPFADAKAGDKFTISVNANGYTKDYEFTYTIAEEESEYSYVYAGLSWAEYWAAEDVQAAGSAATSDEVDTKGEYDKGAFDTVTRATTNHGLHRGSFQCNATIYMKDGTTYDVAYYTGATSAVLTNGETVEYDKADIDHYIVKGLKYVPVKVKTADLDALKASYSVVENGSELNGGYSEGNLSGYTGLIANVTENTNGLKTATKNADGSFSFSARATGTESGIKDQALKTAPSAEDAGLTVQEANGSFGEFLRVDLNKDYGDLGANMQTVTWKYYGNDASYQNVLATYGTKFASDNWMHKSMGIQLGLTKSLRCTLPEGYDGAGYWTITISALGYEDVTYSFQATEENIVGEDPVQDTSALEAAIAKAEALNESDYTAESWAAMQVELSEAKEELEAKHTQAAVDEATEHLNAAIDALVKVDAADEYSYVYAGLSWAEYWAAEDVQAAGSAATSDEVDTKGEYDKGAFDTVTRATTNHGLHRGSFQCNATIYMKDGTTYDVAYYTGATSAVLTNGETVEYDKADIDHYIVKGLKYVPVKVKTADLDALKASYSVVENGSELNGGYSEGNLSGYTGLIANVTENTNGLKTATKNADGSFSFSARATGTESGIKDQALKTAPSAEDAGLTVQEANGSFGEFLRVDLNKDYGDLGANMQTVTWKYYGNDASYQNVLATYGTKFASDNWMHKSMGIQLGLTKSLRCTLPEGYDGAGYWTITISALGYEDVTYSFQATEENIVGEDPVQDTSALEAAIAKAEALNESDYTAESWAAMQVELSEAKEELEAKHTQAAVDEATEHLNAAIDALVKVENSGTEVNTANLEKAIANAEALKEADYTADSWNVMQAALTDAKKALDAKESQEAVDKAADTLNAAVAALVKAEEQPVKVDTSSLDKAIKDAEALKEADYTADSWKALQSALADAKKAKEAGESQEAVDKAANSLNDAIKALVKKGTTTNKTTQNTNKTNNTTNTKTNGKNSVKTGDPANVLGMLGLAISSLGAGVGSITWKRRKRK